MNTESETRKMIRDGKIAQRAKLATEANALKKSGYSILGISERMGLPESSIRQLLG
jgi:hypothetical protein